MEENFNHIMVDIETMGNRPYSAIVSIGAVEFDIETGQTGREFYVNVDLKSCIDSGLKMNADTVMWWMSQGDSARKGLFEGKPLDLKVALAYLSSWLPEKGILWGNSARFDLGILHDAFEVAGMTVPWKYYNERCVRTLVSFAPEIKDNYIHNGVDHNALSDCHKQIGYCSQTWKALKDTGNEKGTESLATGEA